MRRRWTEEEEDRLIDLFEKTDNDTLCRMFNRSEESIKTKAYEFGLKKDSSVRKKPLSNTRKDRWTDEELKILESCFPHMETRKVPIDRTTSAITMMAKKLRIEKTEKHIKKCRYLYNRMIARDLRREGEHLWE